MAKDNKTRSTQLEQTIVASTYGLPEEYVSRNRQRIADASKAVDEIIGIKGYATSSGRGSSPVEDLAQAVRATLRYTKSETGANGQQISGSGVRSIQFDSLTPGESELIQGLSKVQQDRFTLMPEYRAVVAIIPELRRVISLISRDILNRDEFSKKALKNLYKNEILRDKQASDRINRAIDEKIVDRYRLESKLRRWVESSLVEGAHPVAVFPYRTIFEQIAMIPGAEVKAGKSSEGTSIYSMDIPKAQEKNLYSRNIFGTESSFLDGSTYKDLSPSVKSTLEKIIDDDFAEELYDEMDMNIESRIRRLEAQDESSFGTEAYVPDNIKDRIRTALKDGRKPENVEKRNEMIRSKIAPLVELIDSNIQFVTPDKAGVSVARKNMTRSNDLRAKSFEKPKDGSTSPIFSYKSPDDATKMMADGSRKDDAKDDFAKKWESSELSREVLLVEYDPELVIPVIVAGEHIGYYVLEFEAFYGPEYRARKKIGSFTDLVKGLGIGDDKSVVSTMNAVGDTDPLSSSLFTPLPIVAGSQMMMNTVQGMTDEDRKMETLKRVVLQTISEKVKDRGVVDDKRFKDAIAGMIRNGHIVNKKIIMTYIPADNMVYFARKLDSEGMPISILDGTLMYCYMYIASKMSSAMIKLMKSADKEKILVNMGMTGQLNYTLAEIEKSLSTRNVNVQSFFSNVGQVIRNSATYQKLKIPVVEGEQLYDVQQIERVNDISPDDEFTEKLLRSVLMTMGVQSSMLNNLDDNEFSRSIVVQNLEYRANIMDSQPTYEEDTTKLVRLIAKYTRIEAPEIDPGAKKKGNNKPGTGKAFKEIDLNDIKVVFTVPTFLSVANVNEQISSAQTLVDSIVSLYVGDTSDENLSNIKAKLFRKELYKIFANNVDWTDIEKMYKGIEGNVYPEILKGMKEKAIVQKITDTGEYDPAQDSPGGGGGGDYGGGGDFGGGGDDFGGDMGGDDEFGGDGGDTGSEDEFSTEETPEGGTDEPGSDSSSLDTF